MKYSVAVMLLIGAINTTEVPQYANFQGLPHSTGDNW